MTCRYVRIVSFALVCGVTAACATTEPQANGELRPDDFARGATLAPPPGQPFFLIETPAEVFTETAWPDQRDIRIFNASGAMVPYARISSRPAAGAAPRVPLRSFQLQGVEPGGDPIVELDTRDTGVRLRVTPTTSGETVEYLLALEPGQTSAINALHFEWEDAGRNWQQQVNVEVSQSLSSWTRVATARPIMDLRAGDERLRHAEVPISQVMPGWARYWRVRFGPGFAPVLTSVEAELASEPVEAQPVLVEVTSETMPDGSLVLKLPTPQPVARIGIMPAEPNSVLPLVIEGRRGEERWRTLRTAVAYRINSTDGEQQSAPIRLGTELVDAIRIAPVGTSWRDSPPYISVQRPGLSLVVNARGRGPFLLAWGSRAADDSAVSLDTLMPNQTAEVLAALPGVSIGNRQELGGPERLTAPTPAERASRTQTTLVWVLLVTGALSLGALAFKVYKETSGGDVPAP